MKQCKKCPWRVDVSPHDIPNGYCEQKHAALEKTIAKDANLGGELHIMACHETHASPCVGYLHNQLGAGNNLGLRIWAIKNLKTKLVLVGKQHETFGDTLPCNQ